jgi:glucose/arabinose dehydrogenase
MRSKLKLYVFGLVSTGLSLTSYGQTPSGVEKNYPTDAKTLATGKTLFANTCAACHSLTNEGIGPRLGAVTQILSKNSLIRFIQNPSKVLESGDKRAVSLHQKYKQTMPGFDYLKKEEIEALLAYIDHESTLAKLTPLAVETPASDQPARLAPPIATSDLKIELEEFIQLPASSDKLPMTRLATLRAFPANDGTLFASDQRGIIHRISQGKSSAFLDLREKVNDFINVTGLGTGLGSFAFHPDFLSNGLIYITHTEAYKKQPADYEYADSIPVKLQWVLSEWKMRDIKSAEFEGESRELLRINMPGDVHGVQDIGFEPGLPKNHPNYGKLFIGIGDGGSTIAQYPQLCHSKNSLLGTILRIDPLGTNSRNSRYGIPSDNPFVKDTDPEVRKEIWAYGFRNPHRMAWDKVNGRSILLASEVSESNFEEINLVEKGKDYGWNVREGFYGISHRDLKKVFPLAPGEEKGFEPPFALYDHFDGAAISGGYVYHGNLKALQDKYVFGDIVSGKLFFIQIDKKLSRPTVREMHIVQNGKETDLIALTGSKRVDLRICYNEFTHEMYVMTKSDGKIRKIVKAYTKN